MSFEAVRGQEKATRMLRAFLETGRVPAAILFAGPPGVGKAMMAMEFAAALLCPNRRASGGCATCQECQSIRKGIHPDVKRVDALFQATLRGEEPAKQKTLRTETIRHLRQDMSMQSMLGSWKAAIIDDAHTLEPEAANALLKILEEPPEKTLWILVTSHKERLLKTIQSRCLTVPFAPLPTALVEELLRGLGSDPALARLADGSVSRALALQEAGQTARDILSNPLAGLKAADGLPRELHLARPKVEETIFALAQEMRSRAMEGRKPFRSVERPLRKLWRLRQALASNADPKLVMILAAEAVR